MRADAIELRIYIEGILLPPRAWGEFQMTTARGAATNGSLTIPAVPGLRQEDLARARVQVFWSDIEIRNRTNKWPLLFEGEIAEASFSKTPTSRHIRFPLVGPEIYWEQCRLYFYSADRDVNGQGGSNLDLEVTKKALFFGNSSVEFDSGAPGLGVTNRVVAKMREGMRDDKIHPDMIRRILKDVFTSTNFFFRRANEELKLDRRFAVPRDDNISLLYAKTQLFFDQIEWSVGAQEGPTPLIDVMRDVMKYLRYQMVSNPQPRFLSSGEQYHLRSGEERRRLEAKVYAKIQERFGARAEEIVVTADSTDAELYELARDTTSDLLRADPTTLSDEEIDFISDPSKTNADIAEENRRRIGDAWSFLKTIRDELRRIDQPATEVDKNQLVPSEDGFPEDELAQFLLLPDTDFSLPPVCNVIFPTESSSYSIHQNFLREPTRSMLSTPVVTSNIQKVFFAPESIMGARIPPQAIPTASATGAYPPVTTGQKGSRFGVRKAPVRRPDGAAYEGHAGLDIKVPEGTPVHAFDDGKVILAGLRGNAGVMVALDHGNGVITQYMHLSSVRVSVGEEVPAGWVIGYSGNTGRSSGPHLHFGYRVNGVNVDPEPYFDQALANFRSSAAEELGQSLEIPEITLLQGVERDSRFEDFKYLTPEEDIRGIVPVFDTSMDRVSASLERDRSESFDNYMRQYAMASFQRSKYGSRATGQVPSPFSPQLIAGFPGLVVDGVRSILAQVESVTHTISNQGNGDASTVTSLSQPRFWDEGDPFYWKGGEAKFKAGEKIQSVPDAEVARFPSFHLPALVATNSYEKSPLSESQEQFGGSKKNRPIDELYMSLLGVPAIPYFYAERDSPSMGATVSFNEAIDGFDQGGKRSTRTIVGYYENLLRENRELAHQFTRDYTRRIGAAEDEYMEGFLRARPAAGGYTGGPFRERVQAAVRSFLDTLNSSTSFRG